MKKIYDITKCASGNVLGIGVDEYMSKILEQNELVLNCNLLDSCTATRINQTKKEKKEQEKKKKLKKIRIKNIRKIFKKKKVDFIICNIESIKKYLKTFVKDSVYINKDMLYIYNIKDEDLKEELIKKYRRYTKKVEVIKDEKTYILKIDNKDSKTNIIKDSLYILIDTFIQLINIISDILMS